MVENFNGKVDFIWEIANLLRGDYKQSEYRDVILPLTVLRRLDCVTQQNKEEVLLKYEELEERGLGDIDNVEQILKNASGHPVYNTSEYTFDKLCSEPDQLSENLKFYIESFNPNAREILEKFEFKHEIDKLEDADILFQVVSSFAEIDLHPDVVENEEMGYIYEELIRKFSELSNETAGEHFTPREVIELMTRLIFAEDGDIKIPGVIKTIYDPACGTGGMLSVADKTLNDLNSDAQLEMFGQELNDESYAICNSDMLIKGHNPDRIVNGNSFTDDGFPNKIFDYMLSNPPFGVSWKKVKDEIEREHEEQGLDGRFGVGTPRVNDGSMLFLQHMLSKRKSPKEDGSRVAIVFNGSPLFNGGPNSGESAIRRWIIENDWLDTIIGLPDRLFYNTDINTYIWILDNDKPEYRKGSVQLIDARDFYSSMRKNLGDKGKELENNHINKIVTIYKKFEKSGNSKIINNTEFGYRRIVVDRPLRQNYRVSESRISNLDNERAFTNRNEELQDKIKSVLSKMDSERIWEDVTKFRQVLHERLEESGLDPRNSVLKAIERALGERDAEAEISVDLKGEPRHDGELRDYIRIPLDEDPFAYFEREVKPHWPSSWLNDSSRYYDDKDEKLGSVGYEINFEKFFHDYEEPRDLKEIDEDIEEVELEIRDLMIEVTENE